MLLLGGKNLVPLVSAAVIQSIGWRWVFIIVGIIVAVMFVLTYLCVPETSWDRTPITADRLRRHESRSSLRNRIPTKESNSSASTDEKPSNDEIFSPIPSSRVRFAPDIERPAISSIIPSARNEVRRSKSESVLSAGNPPPTNGLPSLPNASPAALDLATTASFSHSESHHSLPRPRSSHSLRRLEKQEYAFQVPPQDVEPILSNLSQHSTHSDPGHPDEATEEVAYRFKKKTYREMLVVYQGRISREKWWKAALRPFILYAYPAIAFATLLYSLSVVWLIVLSEVVAQIFEVP
jgi:Major Facilitator Superfamily